MREHKTYLDLIRLAAAYCVVLMHTAASGLRYEVCMRPGWLGLAAVSSFTFCAVPLFFMMSGYLMLKSEVDPVVMLQKRIPRLLIPLLFWSAMHIAWSAFTQNTWSLRFFWGGITQALQKPANISFWFMYTLMGMYLIAPILVQIVRNEDRRLHFYVIGLIFVLKLLTLIRILFPALYSTYLAFEVMDGINFFGGHLCSFILGWYLGKAEKKISSPAIGAAALISYGIILAGTIARSVSSGTYVQDFQSQSSFFEIFFAACLFMLAKNLKFTRNEKAESVLKRLAPYSFCVYLSHNLFLRIYTYYCESTPLSFSGIAILASVVFTIGIILGELLSHIPYLRYLTLGKSK